MTDNGDNGDSGDRKYGWQMAERLIAEFAARLRNLARRFGRRDDEAEDLMQEVFIRFRNVNPDTVREPEAYLVTVALNILREWEARDRPTRSAVDVSDPIAEGFHPALSVTPGFGAMIDSERQNKRLRAVLAELRPKCRAAVALHYFHGLKCEEVAERMGLSTESVRKYVKQALAHCRRRMSHPDWTHEDD
jgi:RNA polymerase sigma factor (sigma-70 family)